MRLDARQGETGRIRQSFRSGAKKHRPRRDARNFRLQLVPPDGEGRSFLPPPDARGAEGGGHSGYAGNVLGSGAQPPLLPATAEERLLYVVRVRAKTKRPGPFRATEFMRRQDDRVGSQALDVTIDPARRLNGVADQKPTRRVDHLRRCRDWLNNPRFVVGGLKRQHNAMSRGARAGESRAKCLNIEHASRSKTGKFNLRGGKTMPREDSGMFPGTCHEQVEGPFFVRRLDRGRQRQIQRLRPSRGKNDIFGRDSGKCSELGTGSFDHGPRRSPFGMNGRGVAAKIEGSAHRLARRRMQGGRGVMVKVNTLARDERNLQPPQTVELSGRAIRMPPMSANQKRLQSNGTCVLEDPPGLPGFVEPDFDTRRLCPIARLLLGAARLPKSSEPQMPLMHARNARKVGNVESHGRSA
jgi:hypothetical protein